MTITINGSGTITGVSAGGLPDGSVTDSTLALTANSQEVKDALNASGSAPIYACRAWVNFNGTGTVAIRASGNVSSITDNGTGNYTVNFTTAMPDANYAVNGTVGDTTNNYGSALVFGSRANLWTQLTSSISFIVSISTVNYDATNINVSVFR